MRRRTLWRPLFAASSLLMALTLPAAAEDEVPDEGTGPWAELVEAFTEADVSLGLRYRFETVSEDSFDKDANASTLRTILAYRTGTFRGASFFLEFEDVSDIGTAGGYDNAGQNGLGNGITDRPVIADPEVTEIGQISLRLTVPGHTALEVGRREINLDNQRFVGAVGWRQNHQSLELALVESEPVDGLTLTYAYVDRVNRIFGDSKPMSSHLLNGRYELAFGSITAYAYLLDYDHLEDAGLSTATYGARLVGEHEVGSLTFRYQGEYASQRDRGDNPNDVDADYVLAKLGAASHGVAVDIGYELLAGSPRHGRFTTPLATLHAFDGWADKFLVTPVNGLRDLYGSIAYTRGSLSLLAVYHQFDADEGSADYGSEIDAQITWKSPWKQLFAAKTAFYDADTHGSDTDKVWLWTAYSF